MRDFLMEQVFQSFRINAIADEIVKLMNERVRAICSNEILRISMLLDPRFAYDNNIIGQESWKIVEQQLIQFAKESKHINKNNNNNNK